MSNELYKPGESNPASNPKPKFGLTGLAARKAAEAAKALELNPNKPIEINPSELPHRIGIVFDDSGSMETGGKINDAHEGVEEFLRSCEKNKTAIAMYPMCSAKLELCANLPAVAIMTKAIKATGGSTPLLQTLHKLKTENNLTRMIVFSDGMPDSDNLAGITKDFGIVDTVFISDADDFLYKEAAVFMEDLAKRTGGIYLKFVRGKSNFRTAFKYLAPPLRYMLANQSFKDKLEGK